MCNKLFPIELFLEKFPPIYLKQFVFPQKQTLTSAGVGFPVKLKVSRGLFPTLIFCSVITTTSIMSALIMPLSLFFSKETPVILVMLLECDLSIKRSVHTCLLPSIFRAAVLFLARVTQIVPANHKSVFVFF